jgi:4-amino-4-deoxy-L-arabinose transferase-like glycosyltransferase
MRNEYSSVEETDTTPQAGNLTLPSSLIPYHLFLLLLCAIYLVVAALFAIYTPPWQAPDEPAHYNYVRQVAEAGCCPVIEMSDWNLAYQSELTSQRFTPNLLDDLPTLQYEDHQPPLYYLLASVVFKLTNGSLIALRLFSVLIGLGVVLSAYGIGRAIYPQRPWIALGAAAFVAFLPQHVAIMASVNNDGLAEVIIGVTLLATVWYMNAESMPAVGATRASPLLRTIRPWHLGILVGIGFLTKASTLLLVGVVPLAILLKWWIERRGTGDRSAGQIRALLMRLVSFAIPALLLGAIWWTRNVNVYGWPDVLGLRQHDLVVAGQPRTADYIAQNGWQMYWNRAFTETFNSFWGQFGWMAVPMPEWIYRIVQVFLVIVVSGLALGLRRTSRSPTDDTMTQRSAWIILLVTLALALAAFVYYNTEFLQHQGRYLFPGLIPFALLMAFGLDGWMKIVESLLTRHRGELAVRPYLLWLTALAFLPLAALDVYLLWRVIVPGLSP